MDHVTLGFDSDIVLFSQNFTGMNNPPTFQPLGVFRLMALPAELRRRVYYFAFVAPHPLPLLTHCYRCMDYGYSVAKDLRMLGTYKEFRREISGLLYAKNSFTYVISRDEAEDHDETSQIDLKRVQKCYISIEDTTEYPDDSEWEMGFNLFFEDEALLEDFNFFVTTLAFKSHELKYVLIECKPQDYMYLADVLSPLFLLRNIGLVHFRSRQTAIRRYFRFLEDFMMSDRPVPFSNLDDFWVNESRRLRMLDCSEESWLVKDRDTMARVAVRPQEQLEVTAKELYSFLGVEGDFIPQSETSETE